MYTLQIDVQSTNPLDGTTQLDINAPGVTVDKVTNRTVIVTLDGTQVPNFGRLDPGQVVESQIPRLAGKVLMLVGFSATADGQPFPVFGNTLARVTPRQGAQEGIEPLANLGDLAVQGMVFGTPELFPLAHLIALTTTVAGPTRLIFVLQELTDDDVVKLGCCGGGGAGGAPLQVNDEGIPVDLNTTLLNFTGAGVTATPAGPPGAVNVTIPGAGLAVEVDMSLDPFGPPINQAPYRFIDMPPIAAQLGLLPLMSSGSPVANRLWFGRLAILGITPGIYSLRNTDIRGGDPDSTQFFNTRGQTEMVSGLDGVVQFQDVKRVVDLRIDAGPPGFAGPFWKTNGRGIYLENITTTGPANGAPGLPPFVDTFGARWVIDRCELGNPGIEARGAGVISTLVIEDDTWIGSGALHGTGSMRVQVRGTGNTFSPFMGFALASLDVDIGHSGIVSPPWSGAESINFGCGPLDFDATPGTFLLFPGGGDPTSPAPVPIAGPDYPSMIGYKDGILRGIQLNAGGPFAGGPVIIDVIVGGVIVYTETIGIAGGVLGAFASTNFGFMSAGALSRDIAIAITNANPPPGAGSFAYVNVGVLIK